LKSTRLPKRSNVLGAYPTSSTKRVIQRGQRGLQERLIASERDSRFFDGERNYGYGGLKYDGRWQNVAESFINKFNLHRYSRILQIQTEKGFLIHEFGKILGQDSILGTEDSNYALEHLHGFASGRVLLASPVTLPFPDNTFDLVICLGVTYTQNLGGAVAVLREIERVSRGASFITVANAESERDHELMREWSLLGNLIFSEEDWLTIFHYAGFTGSYDLVNAESLGLAFND